MIFELGAWKPDIAQDVGFIAPNAAVIGNVTLKSRASIWFHVTLRGDNEPMSIGEGSNIQDGSVCHSDPGMPLVVGAHVTVGHGVILHGCTIEDGALVGMGSQVLNGARVGAGALLGAGSFLAEGKEVPPNMLAFGRPAKVIRELSPNERDLLAVSAEIYVANAEKYKAELKPVAFD